ncbi:MAG: hypothetical protein ACI30S_01035 [Muribaculaceae bacterium]
MGMVLTRYNMLTQLRDETRDNNVKRFELTALVLHDPDDTDFCNMIKSGFDRYCMMTGKKFLFITYVKPDEKYKHDYSSSYVFEPECLYYDSVYDTDMERDAISLIRNSFSIPETGSYMLLFDDFGNTENNSFALIKTNKSSFVGQLDLITAYCENDSPDKLYDKLIQDLGGDIRNPEINVFSTVLGIAATTSNLKDSFEYVRKQQINDAFSFVETQRNYISNSVKGQDCDSEDIIDSISQRLIELYNLLSKLKLSNPSQRRSQRPSNSHFGNRPPRGGYGMYFEDEYATFQHDDNLAVRLEEAFDEHYKEFSERSKCFFETLIHLLHLPMNNLIDYSYFVIYFAKIIEQELNLSIGQLIRERLGVPMPDFYNIVYFAINNLYVYTNNRNVNFNQPLHPNSNDRTLKYVTIGELLCSLEIMNDNYEDFYALSPVDLGTIYSFRDLRNRCCHSEIIDDVDLNEVTNQFLYFCDYLLPELCEIKRSLRS